jgi:biopolymer transport protein ExbB
MEFMEWMDRGGIIAWILLVFSVYALAIILIKTAHLFRLRNTHRVEEAIELLKQGDSDRALKALAISSAPAARVVEGVISGMKEELLNEAVMREEIETLGGHELNRARRGLRSLDAIAHLSPLLGLLGTVLGMIEAFIQLEGAGTQVDVGLLAGGIWEALVTTAAGLAVAIPALAALNALEGMVERMREEMVQLAARAVVYARQARITVNR